MLDLGKFHISFDPFYDLIDLITLIANMIFLLKFDPKIRKISGHLWCGSFIEVQLE